MPWSAQPVFEYTNVVAPSLGNLCAPVDLGPCPAGAPFGLAPKPGGAIDGLADDPDAEVPAAALVIERNVLGGSGTAEVLLGPASGTPCLEPPGGTACLGP